MFLSTRRFMFLFIMLSNGSTVSGNELTLTCSHEQWTQLGQKKYFHRHSRWTRKTSRSAECSQQEEFLKYITSFVVAANIALIIRKSIRLVAILMKNLFLPKFDHDWFVSSEIQSFICANRIKLPRRKLVTLRLMKYLEKTPRSSNWHARMYGKIWDKKTAWQMITNGTQLPLWYKYDKS